MSKLAAPITPGGIGSKIFLLYSCSLTLLTHFAHSLCSLTTSALLW
ncbi:hypothetical protein XS46_001843 [Salmonella enterica subsp. enterica]|nr:hypothetical protein [Salmonella enterica subsp. enterica]